MKMYELDKNEKENRKALQDLVDLVNKINNDEIIKNYQLIRQDQIKIELKFKNNIESEYKKYLFILNQWLNNAISRQEFTEKLSVEPRIALNSFQNQ
jgi:hypothetical protein